MLTVTDRRAFGSLLLASYLPCAYRTDPKKGRTPSPEEAVSWESFQEITNGVWRPTPFIDEKHPGSGTTCGFLTSWFQWRIGCTDRNVVNRTFAAAGGAAIGTYTAGHNICAVRGACGDESDKNKRRHSHYVKIHGSPSNTAAFAADGLRPKLGDIVHVNTDPNTHKDHVFIFLHAFEDADGTERWQTAEAGGPTPDYAGKQMKTSFWREQAVFSNKRTIGRGRGAIKLLSREPGAASPTTDTRSLMGWVDLDRITGLGAARAQPRPAVVGAGPSAAGEAAERARGTLVRAGGGRRVVGGLLPAIGTDGAPPASASPAPVPPSAPPPAPGTITLPGGFTIPNPFGFG